MKKAIHGLMITALLALSLQPVMADTGYGDSAAGTLTSVAPDAPVLTSPANHTTGVGGTVLDWEDLDHAASFTLQVSTASDFNTLIVDESGITESTFDATDLQATTQYFWRVCATNVAGAGDYSETWDFTTSGTVPVELSSFTAVPGKNGINLNWTTASETNNLGFILERTRDLTEHPDWTEIASYHTHPGLRGQGTSNRAVQYAYTDNSAGAGVSCYYRLSDVSTSGDVNVYHDIRSAMIKAPRETALYALYPNPFNPQTRISYTLAQETPVEIAVYDIRGRKVVELVNTRQAAGSYQVYWNGRSGSGVQMATGMYLITLKTNQQTMTQKALLIK